MKDFLLDNNGDIVIKKNDIGIVEAQNEIAQQIKQVLSSNNGEWIFNEKYGINFHNLLVKTIDNEIIIDEINKGLAQCSGDIVLDTIDIKVDRQARKLSVSFYAHIGDEQVVVEELEIL